jgi:hypothetical protein
MRKHSHAKPKRSIKEAMRQAREEDLNRLQRAHKSLEEMSRYAGQLLEKIANLEKALHHREDIIHSLKQALDEAENRAIRAASFD